MTGASDGIGAEIARALGARGAALVVSARRRDRLEAIADELEATTGRRPAVLPADLSERGAAHRLAARALEALGGIDVLVNNAGPG